MCVSIIEVVIIKSLYVDLQRLIWRDYGVTHLFYKFVATINLLQPNIVLSSFGMESFFFWKAICFLDFTINYITRIDVEKEKPVAIRQLWVTSGMLREKPLNQEGCKNGYRKIFKVNLGIWVFLFDCTIYVLSEITNWNIFFLPDIFCFFNLCYCKDFKIFHENHNPACSDRIWLVPPHLLLSLDWTQIIEFFLVGWVNTNYNYKVTSN